MHGYRDDELTTRWVQLGVFSPILRLHSTDNPFNGKEPWNFGPAYALVMKDFLRLRHRLIPYLYSMNRLANQEGLPLVKPLYWKEPEREELYKEKRLRGEYYFGEDYLVAPITTPIDKASGLAKVSLWLPEGIWYDAFTGIRYRGGRMLDAYRPLELYPVFIREGRIAYYQEDVTSNGAENPDGFVFDIFPCTEARAIIWEDDGRVGAEDAWVQTKVRVWEEGEELVFSVETSGNLSAIPGKRNYQFNLYGMQSNEGAKQGIRSFRMENVPTGEALCVRMNIGEEPDRYRQDELIRERIYGLLNQAQIPFDEKSAIYQAVEEQGKDAIASVMTLTRNKSLKGSIVELLTAE